MTILEQSRIDKLAQLRDELKLKLHLAGAELRTHWEELEEKWILLQSRLSGVKHAGAESAHEIRAAANLLANELADGYERIREAFNRLG